MACVDGTNDEFAREWNEAETQHSAERLAAEEAAWLANPAQPYLLTFSGNPEELPHRFCPKDPAPGSDCPNCKKPLLHLLSLDTTSLPFLVRPHLPAIHLLYCWTCAIPYDRFRYRIQSDGSVEILQALDKYEYSFGAGGPYDGYTGIFPESPVGLRALSVEEQDLARRLQEGEHSSGEYRYLTEPVHQIGGMPMIYNWEVVECSECGQTAPFFATICDNATGQDSQPEPSLTFTNYWGVQMVFHWCEACAIMTAYHSCD